MESRFRYYQRDGITRTLVHDDAEPYKFHVATEVELDEVMASIARDRDNIRNGSVNKLAARVPLTIYEQSIHEGWDEDKWKEWLNNVDNKAFRIWPGKV